MKQLKNNLGYITLFMLVLLGLVNKELLSLYKGIVLNSNLIVLFATLIAGLFGFIIAVIPFAIQLFNQDKKRSSFHKELLTKKQFDTFIVPMFKRFSKILRIMFSFFIFISFLHLIQTIDIKSFNFLESFYGHVKLKDYFILLIFYIYIMYIWYFFAMLRKIVRDLDTMISIFIKEKRKDLK